MRSTSCSLAAGSPFAEYTLYCKTDTIPLGYGGTTPNARFLITTKILCRIQPERLSIFFQTVKHCGLVTTFPAAGLSGSKPVLVSVALNCPPSFYCCCANALHP